MNTLILGGIKSGKSRHAEALAVRSGKSIAVIATATAEDEEMRVRIKHHQDARSPDWQVIEEPLALAAALVQPLAENKCVVVDCLTLCMINLLVSGDESLLAAARQALFDCLASNSGSIILASNETSMGIMPMGSLTRRFCDESGLLHQRLAEQCDNVALIVAGIPMVLKGCIDNG